MKFRIVNINRYLTTREAVEKSSLTMDELFANLIDCLINKKMLTIEEVSEIFYWDYEVIE